MELLVARILSGSWQFLNAEPFGNFSKLPETASPKEIKIIKVATSGDVLAS